MIKLEHIYKTYNTSDTSFNALDDINITLPNKGLVSLFGRSGAGKTTLLNIIAKIENPTKGNIKSDIFYDYAPIIFQNAELLEDLDVVDNLLIIANLYKKEKSDVEELLEKFGIKNFGSKKINQLSAGEKQRVTIIRSLLADSPILLADEPTANLDLENAKMIAENLKEVSKSKLVVNVTHDVEIFKDISDMYYEMESGKIVDSFVGFKNDDVICNSYTSNLGIKPIANLSKNSIRKNIFRYIFLTLSLLISFSLLLFSLNVLSLNENKVKYYYNNKLAYKEFELIYNHDKNALDSMLDFDMSKLDYNYITTIYIECHATFDQSRKIGDYIFQTQECPYEMIEGSKNVEKLGEIIPSTYADDIIKKTTINSYKELIGCSVQLFGRNLHIAGVYNSKKLYEGHMPVIVREEDSTPSDPKEYAWGLVSAYNETSKMMESMILEDSYNLVASIGNMPQNEYEITIGRREAMAMVSYHVEEIDTVIGKEFGSYTFVKPTYYQKNNTNITNISDYNKKLGPITFKIVGICGDSGLYVSHDLYDNLMSNYITQEYRYGIAIKDKLNKKDYKKLSEMNIIDSTQYTEVVEETFKNVEKISLITTGVGALMLVVSICILANYYSLSQTKKNKEVGILASFGIKKNRLLFFMCFDIFISTIIAILLANIVLPIINLMINSFIVDSGYSLINVMYYSPYTIIYSLILFGIILGFTTLISILKNKKRSIADMIYNI